MAEKKTTVTDLARKYGVGAKDVIRELNGQGIETPKAEKTVLAGDDLALIDSFLADLYAQDDDRPAAGNSKKKHGAVRPEKGGNAAATAKREIHLSRPVLVKDLAAAVGQKPNELITDLMKLGELAG
ncbi:MAG: translation initiation factor IF-2 N-terminal domain-containing protein, partial [Victivallaceae bacterium]|nr:translation initiation factor IF-2 N-terminal domain-containing protein [Victivallaceae bacterium]